MFELDAADDDQWNLSNQFLPFADALKALWGATHLLQRRLKDRSKRDVIRLVAQRGLKLFVIMCRKPERNAIFLDCRNIRRLQILLAEVHVVRARGDRGLPIVVHDDFGLRVFSNVQRAANDFQRGLLAKVFRAQLDRAYVQLRQTFDPFQAVDDGIEAVRMAGHGRHLRTASRQPASRPAQSRVASSSRLRRHGVPLRWLARRLWPSRRDFRNPRPRYSKARRHIPFRAFSRTWTARRDRRR